MSEREQQALSREELDAILESADAETAGGPGSARWKPTRIGISRIGALARSLERFGQEQGRQLSTQYQRALSFTMCACEATSTSEFVGSMISQDLVILVELQPAKLPGAVLIGRSLFYGWLNMTLGGSSTSDLEIPRRPYSPIERRFVRVVGSELTGHLEQAFAPALPLKLQIRDVVPPELAPEALPPRLWVASYEVEGFGEVARLRFAFPSAWVEELEGGPEEAHALPSAARIGSRIREAPITVRAEIGGTDLGLRRFAELRVGDTLPLEAEVGGSLLIRLEDKPKFRAVPGSVGSRLAIRVVEEI